MPSTGFTGSLAELGEVRVRLATSEAERRLCAGLLDQHHPLGPGRAPGCRLSYLLAADCGPLGVLSFVAAAFRLGPRDAFLEWDDRTRGAHIERILSNDRFVLVPGVQIPNLASHVLGKTIKRLARDWEQAHGVRPWLVETCVQSSRPGTSYKAAGWQCVGPTQGRPPGAGEAVETKAVWLLGLDANWQQQLCRKPEQKLGQYPELVLDEEANWARREYLRSDLPDGRLRQRLERMGQSWERHPGEDLPAIFPHQGELRAATRLLHNDKVQDRDILQPHREALLERVQVESTVLLVQDTTTLNYTNLQGCTSGLGPLQDRASSSRGLFVHATVGFTEGGRPLGVSGLERWARPEQEPDPEAEQEQEKESRRWAGVGAWERRRGGRRERARRSRSRRQHRPCSRRSAGWGSWVWMRTGSSSCAGSRSRSWGSTRSWSWTRRRTGHGGSTCVRTCRTGGCGSGWSGWGRAGSG